jgi:hypothetical protein
MERGDISSWTTTRIIVVLEGVLATPAYESSGVVRRRRELLDPDEWVWEDLPLRYVVDYARRLNVAVEIVTFMGQEVADAAADWFSRYGVEIAEVLAVDFAAFCRSLLWRLTDVQRVIDTDPDRIQNYGQLGYVALRGERF